MLQRYEAKVIEKPKQIKAKYGFCSLIKLQLISTNEEVVIFSKENDANVLKRYKGEVVECYQDNNQKWKLLTTIPTNNSNGSNGNIQMNRLSHDSGANRNYYINNNNSPEINSIPSNTQDDIESLDLPDPLSDADKIRLNKLIRERARLLTRTIEVMREELNANGLEFHEGSLRSLAVSLFIHISRHLD